MKKVTALVLTLCLLMMTAAFGVAETADDSAEALALLENIKGTYEPLFPVITAPEYDQIWMDPCVAALGEENAPAMVEMLKSACSGTIYGQEAVDAFGDGSNGAQFDCLFINGVSRITFDGTVISGVDENGNAADVAAGQQVRFRAAFLRAFRHSGRHRLRVARSAPVDHRNLTHAVSFLSSLSASLYENRRGRIVSRDRLHPSRLRCR